MSQNVTLFGLPPSLESGRARMLGGRLGQLLGELLDHPVVIGMADTYSELADDLSEGRLDYAWVPPLEAAQLQAALGAEPLVQAERGGGAGYHSVVFVHRESDIGSLGELAGQVVAFVHRRSAAGYLVPAGLLAEQGVSIATPPMFAGSHADVVERVEGGEAAAGATFATFEGEPGDSPLVVAGWNQAAGRPLDRFRVLAWAGPVPADTVCAWPGTTRAGRTAFREALLGLHQHDEGRELLRELFGAERFVEATQPSLDVLQHALDVLAAARTA